MNVRTADGLIHVLRYDEDRGSYGETLCLLDFTWHDWPHPAGVPPQIEITWQASDDEPISCITCIAGILPPNLWARTKDPL